jgi:anti-sigma factor ChrR (cupin superfamily)
MVGERVNLMGIITLISAFVMRKRVIFNTAGSKIMDVLRYSLKGLITTHLHDDAMGKLPWKDFGNGLAMARLAREGKRELVLYRIEADAAPNAFLRHEHIGGEFYLVLKGAIEDETGLYTEGDIVYLDPKSVHSPRGKGETLVLVLWPEGVRVLE